MILFQHMKWFSFFCCCFLVIHLSAQSVGHIDSLVAGINNKKFTSKIYIDDTIALLSGYKEQNITAYFIGDTIKKVVVRFRNSTRIREVYNGPGKDYENKIIYIKDYDTITNALDAEAYVWKRKLYKSIITNPVNEDERWHPEKMIDRAYYDLLIKYKRAHP